MPTKASSNAPTARIPSVNSEAQAACLDRMADPLLFLGHVAQAERLACIAAEMRAEGWA